MVYINEEKNVQLEDIELTPHFVIKTKIFTPYGRFSTGSKFFINVCTNAKIPQKELFDKSGKLVEGFDAEAIFVAISNGDWEIPILITPEIRETSDKKGNKSLLIDCVINDKYMQWCMVNEDLKDILIQWCIDAIEFQIGDNFIVDRDSITFPKRRCMGGEPENIQIDMNHLLKTTKQLEDLSRDIYEEKDDPMLLVDAKRQQDEDENGANEGISEHGTSVLPPLLPSTAPTKGLIVELDEHEAEQMTRTKIKTKLSQKIRYEVEFSKLPEHKTKSNYKYEVRISSQLKDAKCYQLKFDKNEKELLISNTQDTSVLNFPLPLDISGDDATCFFKRNEHQLFVFIK